MPEVDDLPPMPDRQTGEPRPPKAPTAKPSNEKRKPWNPKKVPQPPEGEGPPLEWGYADTRDKRWIFAVTIILMVGFLILRGTFSAGSSPFGWAAHWQLWALLAVAGLLMAWGGGKATRVSAGADWFMHHSNFVKTYELVSITLKKSWGKDGDLVLTDHHGRKTTTDLSMLRVNEALWDLVYNGIQHSVAKGAIVDPMTVRTLRLYGALAISQRQQGEAD